jgi:hypothetical protein
LAIVKQTAVERLAALLEREVALETFFVSCRPGTRPTSCS